jgi:hypothetical protein
VVAEKVSTYSNALWYLAHYPKRSSVLNLTHDTDSTGSLNSYSSVIYFTSSNVVI